MRNTSNKSNKKTEEEVTEEAKEVTEETKEVTKAPKFVQSTYKTSIYMSVDSTDSRDQKYRWANHITKTNNEVIFKNGTFLARTPEEKRKVQLAMRHFPGAIKEIDKAEMDKKLANNKEKDLKAKLRDIKDPEILALIEKGLQQ